MESCEDCHCFDLSLLPKSMDRDERDQNPSESLTSRTDRENQCIAIVASEEDIWGPNAKLSTGPSPITSTYHHFFYALQKTSNAPGKRFPNSNDFHAGFNIVIYYSPVHALCLPPLWIHFFTNTRPVTPHLCDYFALHTLFFWQLLPISFCLYSFWC